jgi:signal transduction histidine kinase
MNIIIENFKKGFRKLKQNPQLWFSIFVAVIILIAFIFVVNRFLTIAQDSQDDLINKKAGSTLDAFVEFAPEKLDSASGNRELQEVINRIVIGNSTINDFKVVKFENDQPIIINTFDKEQIGQVDELDSQMYAIAKINPFDSYTFPVVEFDGQRLFKTVKVIKNQYGEIIGAANLVHSLSEADQKIQSEIETSIIIFIVIIVAVMALFFRYARIIDYTVLYKKLKEIDSLKDDFISMASHELRTPLTIIRGYAEELSEFDLENPDFKTSVERIDIAARQLDNLVGDMLDVSRIEQGRMKIEFSEVSPAAILSDVVSGLLNVAESKGLKLTLNHQLGQHKINVDPDRFRQVLVNLIGNAVKYTPKGEVKIIAKVEDDKAIIRVQDSGIGISAEDQKKLFQKFSRIKSTETAEIRGTGLGLWITKQIVEEMHGQIFVESIKGVGTSFIVKFPVI